MATAARLARRALLRLLISRLLALGLGINLKLRLNRLLRAAGSTVFSSWVVETDSPFS